MKRIKIVSKEYEYRNQKFSVSIELNTRVERKMNRKTWHTIRISSLGNLTYFISDEIEEKKLKAYLQTEVPIIINGFIDKALDGKTGIEKELEDLGYK